MEVVGAVVTISGLIAGVAKIANAVSTIKEKWRYAPLNISMVSTSLWAIKAALENIAEWRSTTSDESEQSEQLDRNLEVCVESCAVMVAVVENRLKDIDLENISKYDKARFVALDALFKDFASNLRAQVDALQLLLTIYQCRSLSEQNRQLQQVSTRNAVSAVRQSTAGLPYEDKDIEDAASILSEAPSTTFTFDKILMQHQHYSRTYPRLYQHMQLKFPSRSGSVASTIKRSPVKPKRRPVQVIDPLIERNISLPFLGVPFHGENEPDDIEEQSAEAISPPSTEKPIHPQEKVHDSQLSTNSPATKFLHTAISSEEQPAGANSTEEASTDNDLTQRSVTYITKTAADGATTTPTNHNTSKNGKVTPGSTIQRSKSFDSLYDVSDDERSERSSAQSISVKSKSSGTRKSQNDELDENEAVSTKHKELQSGTVPQKEPGASHNDSNATIDDSVDSLKIEEKKQEVTSDIAATGDVDTAVIKGSGDTSSDFEHQDSVSKKHMISTKQMSLPGKNAPHGLASSLLDINFGPDLDLDIATHRKSDEPRQVETSRAPKINHEDSDATLKLFSSAKDPESSDSVRLPKRTDLLDPVLHTQPNRLEPESTAWSPVGTHPQTPRISSYLPVEEANEQSTVSKDNVVDDPPSSALPLRPESTSSVQSKSGTEPRSMIDTFETPIANTFNRRNETINDQDGRNSFQSDNSRYFQAPASPNSIQSQQYPPSSITSTESYMTREQLAHNTPATSMTGPTPLSPRYNLDPVQHEKKRLAITKNLVELARKATPVNRLSNFPGILSLRGSSEKMTRAKELAQHVQSGDAVKLSLFLQQYDKSSEISIFTTLENETAPKTALMRAASLDFGECVQVLLSYDAAGAACVDKQGRTALHYALENGAVTTALWLTDQLCKVVDGNLQYKGKDGQKLYEMPDHQGICPVHLAAQARGHDVLELLHKANANVGARSAKNWSILHFAAAAKSLDNVRYIVRQGLLDVNVKNSMGETPLMLAAAAHDEHSVHFLLENGGQKDLLDNLGNTALHHAASHGNLKGVETLFQSIEDVTAKNFIGEQPLHLAAAGGHTIVLIALLRIPGVQPNIWTEPPHLKHPVDRRQGFAATAKLASTPLHYACASGHHEAADILISRGAMVNANQEDGYTLLMMACQAQSSAIVSLLLLQGADPKASTEKDGLTALHVACRVDDLASTKLLLEYGADVLAKMTTKTKETASMLAFQENAEDAKGAGYYTMRYHRRVLQANAGQQTPNGVVYAGSNNPPGAVMYAPNVRNVQYGGYLVPSQYAYQPQYPIQNAAPLSAATNSEPPPPYQR